METRICKICGISKNLEEYYIHSIYKDTVYRKHECKPCCTHKHKTDITKFIRKKLRVAKSRSINRNLEFDLTKEWYIKNLPEYCPVFNTKLDYGSNIPEYMPSIDRINNSKGYTQSNCRIISWKANDIRNQWSLEELTAVVNYLKEHQ